MNSTLYSALTVLVLGACAALPAPPNADELAPTQWQAPAPANDTAEAPKVRELKSWWHQFDDDLLIELLDLSQRDSPTLAQAAARIEQARAALGVERSALWPSVDANLSATRSGTRLPPPATQTSSSATLDAAWEIDLFGAQRQRRNAAQARFDTSQQQWHDARISLAAELANTYTQLRSCEALVGLYQEELASQQKSSELSAQKVRVGFEAPANAALVRAAAADTANRLISQRAECDINVKALVALTGLNEAALRERLAARTATLPQPARFSFANLPAQVLAQRPDVAAAATEVEAALAEISAADADRYPSISLTGAIGIAGLRLDGVQSEGRTWSFGPALNLPVFDAGRRNALLDSARARYDEAAARYRQKVRDAVREVEEALVRLDAAQRRMADAQNAAQGFDEFFRATQARAEVGIGDLLDLEEARRVALNSKANLLQVQRERVTSWVNLSKALGGGWQGVEEKTNE